MQRKRVIMIGAGPAGIACAIQLKRSGLEPYLMEKREAGGLLQQAHLVENYPGFPEGISGEKLVEQFVLQLERFSIPVHSGEVTFLEPYRKGFLVRTEGAEFETETAVVASGTKPRLLKGIAEMNGTVYYDVRPLLRQREKQVAVIGGGDASFDYALALSERNTVSIFYRRCEPACLELLRGRAERKDSIHLHPNCAVDGIAEKEGKYVITCGNDEFSGGIFDHVLCAIGRVPCTGFLSDDLLLAYERGETVPGLSFIGDVRRGMERQVAIAVGDGIRAAMEIAGTVEKK